MKILIIRLSSIGDIVLTTPVMRCIKKANPQTEIHYLCKKNYVPLLQNNPYIDKIHVYAQNIIKILKQEKFDYIVDLQHNFRSLKLSKQLNAKSYTLNKLNVKKWLLVRFKINKLPALHIVDRYLACAKHLPFAIENDDKGLDFFLKKEDFKIVDEVNLKPFLAISVGSQHYTKQIPIEKLTEICRDFTCPIVLLGGKEDFEKAEQLLNSCKEKEIYNFCGKLSIRQSAAFVERAKVLLTGDTGLMHIAAALKTPIVSVWGNTTPDFGMYPYVSKNLYSIVENKALNCRPCSKLGFEHCPKKHFKCMNDIDNQLIVKLINERFDRY